jgi:hypothetical protein
MKSMSSQAFAERLSGLGRTVKVLEVGEVIQIRAERKKLRERPGIAILHVTEQYRNRVMIVVM